MAFMMPILKKDWDVYGTNPSRRSSESSAAAALRSRKISESAKSEIIAMSSKTGRNSLMTTTTRSVPANMAHLRHISRTNSRSSQMSVQRISPLASPFVTTTSSATRSGTMTTSRATTSLSHVLPTTSKKGGHKSPSPLAATVASSPSCSTSKPKLHTRIMNKLKKTWKKTSKDT